MQIIEIRPLPFCSLQHICPFAFDPRWQAGDCSSFDIFTLFPFAETAVERIRGALLLQMFIFDSVDKSPPPDEHAVVTNKAAGSFSPALQKSPNVSHGGGFLLLFFLAHLLGCR